MKHYQTPTSPGVVWNVTQTETIMLKIGKDEQQQVCRVHSELEQDSEKEVSDKAPDYAEYDQLMHTT
jgi:hypothetical protein